MRSNFTPSHATRFWVIGMLLTMTTIPAHAQVGHVVTVTNNRYTPKDIVINAGDTVVWRCTQGFHNVNGNKGIFPNNPESFGNALGSNWTYTYVFNKQGKYDYQCDPHVALGMVGTVTVNPAIEENQLTLALMGMNPHIGQTLFVSIKSNTNSDEVYRSSLRLAENQELKISDVVPGLSYTIDFFADHNGNGFYDAPPVDHAWQIVTGNLSEGNNRVEFTHNTSFTDINWKYLFQVDFSGMTPHLGQAFNLYLRESVSGDILDSINIMALEEASFSVTSGFQVSKIGEAVLSNLGLMIDFYADHNGNGSYDAPPLDHAWRMEINDFSGDTLLQFSHNTNFTDIFSGSSSVDDWLSASSFDAFPNPVQTDLVLTFNQTTRSDKYLYLYDYKGAMMQSRILPSQLLQLTLDLRDILPGFYSLVLISDGKREIRKIVKL